MKTAKVGGKLLLKISKKEWNTLAKRNYENKPSEKDAIYNAGKLAYKQWKSKEDNPYHKDIEEHNIWNEGYDSGYFEANPSLGTKI